MSKAQQAYITELDDWLIRAGDGRGSVPKLVAKVARKRSRTEMAPADQRFLRALVTSPRMKRVWGELGKRKRRGDGYLHPVRQLKLKPPVADLQGLAMAVLFDHALELMRDVSVDRAAFPAKPRDVAMVRERCRTMAEDLDALARLFLESRSDQSDYEDARKLMAATEVLGRLAVKPCARDRGNTVARYITGDLVRLCRAIFGSEMYGTVATIAGVLLNDSRISVSSIRRWHPRQ